MKTSKYITSVGILCLALCGCVVEMDTPDMSMKTTLGLTLPIGDVAVYNYKFVSFGEGEFAFEDTIRHINLSKIDLSSANDNEYVDTMSLSNIFLFLNTTNELPVDVRFDYICYNDDGEEMDIHFFNNQINIGAGEYNNRGKVVPSQKLDTVHITAEQLQMIKTTGALTYKCTFKSNSDEIIELDECKVKVQIGLCADVNASLNLDPDE